MFHARLCCYKAHGIQDQPRPCNRLLIVLLLFLLLLLVIVLTGLTKEVGPGVGTLLKNLVLGLAELTDLVGRARHALKVVGDLATSNQGSDNGAANNEGEDETVDSVPRRSQTLLSSTRISVVHEVEDQELRDQGRLDRHENSGRGSSSGEDTNLVTLVALVTAEASELKTPVDGAGERDDLRGVSVMCAFRQSNVPGTYRSAVGDLDRLNDVQHELSGLLVQEKTRAGSSSLVDFPSGVHSAEGGGHVRHDTSHTDPVRLLGNVSQAESLLDGFLSASR